MTAPSRPALDDLSVAIVGAGGFLGTNLALALAGRVKELRCFGRRHGFPAATRGLRWVEGDMAGGEIMAALEGCDTVLHLASTSTPSTADRDIAADAEANLLASLRLFDHCLAAGVKRLIFLSSGGTVYGIPQQVPTPEIAPALPITAYGAAKAAIEKYLEVYRCQRGLDYRVLRVANPYGPYQTTEKRQGVVMAFLAGALAGKPLEIWGDGQVVRDYLYVGDVVEAVCAAMTHQGASRIFNIGSGQGLSLLDVIAAIEALLGHPLETRFMPGRPVDVPVSILDCARARQELGWQAHTSFAQGLRLTLDWLRDAA